MANIGFATMQVIPSLRGVETAIKSGMVGPAGAAGAASGAAAGKSFAATMRSFVLKAAIPLAVGAGLFKIGESFDKAFDTIRVGTGATGDRLKGLQKDFKATAKTGPDSFNLVATAIADLNTRTDLAGPPLRTLSRQFLDLSRITKTDLGENIESLTRLFGDWSIAGEDQAGTLDKLFRVSQLTGVGVSNLGRLMVQYGSPLRQLGLGFDFSAAMFAKFEKEGVNIQTAMPGLRMALKNFAKDGREPAEALMETFEAIKNTSSLAEANTIAFRVFGVRAGPDLAAAIREGRFELDDLMDTMVNGSDTIGSASDDVASFGEKWATFKNRVLVGLEPIATKVFTAVGKGMEAFGTHIGTISKVAAVIGVLLVPALVKLGVTSAIAAAKTVASFVLMGFQAVASAVVQTAQVGIMVAKWAVLGTQALAHAAKVALAWIISMGPIGLVVAAVAAAAVLIIRHWDSIQRFVAGAARAVLDFLRRNWPLIVAILTGPLGLAVLAVIRHWDSIKNATSAAIGAVVGFFRALPGRIWDAIKASAGWLVEQAKKIPGWIIDGITATLGGIGEMAKAIPNLIFWAVAGLSGILVDLGRKVVDWIVQGIVGVANRIADAITAPIRRAAGMLGRGGSLNLSDIQGWPPRGAHGFKNFPGGWAIVGEEGPELLRLPRGSDLYPTRESRDMLASAAPAGGDHIEQHFHGIATTDQLMAALDRHERRKALAQ